MVDGRVFEGVWGCRVESRYRGRCLVAEVFEDVLMSGCCVLGLFCCENFDC